MTSSVSVHIVNPNDVVLKLIQDAQGLQGEYESFSIFVDDNDKGNNCDFDDRSSDMVCCHGVDDRSSDMVCCHGVMVNLNCCRNLCSTTATLRR